MTINGLFPADVMTAYVIAAIVATLIVHVAFAGAVMFDTALLRTAMVPRWVWALATLLGGPLVGGLYWIIHRGVPSTIAAPVASPR